MFARIDFLKRKFGFDPKVIYDIGAYQGTWTNDCKKVFPSATYYQFEANDECKSFLSDNPTFGVLGDKDDIEVSYYKWENNFCKSYLFYTDNLTLLDISEQLKKCILEVDNHLYAQTLLQDCSFYTPQFYRFYINIKPMNDSFIIKFILMMEYIDIENNTIVFDETNTTHLQQLKKINECLKKHSLTHNDLAPRNIRIMKTTEKILIYDWGESFISNYGIDVLENMNRKELS